MILNRNEKEALWDLFQGGQANGEEMIDAVIAEVLRKLAAGVSVEPYCKGTTANIPNAIPDLFTRHQLTTAIAAARVAENERCAEHMENQHTWISNVAAATAIRALIGKESES